MQFCPDGTSRIFCGNRNAHLWFCRCSQSSHESKVCRSKISHCGRTLDRLPVEALEAAAVLVLVHALGLEAVEAVEADQDFASISAFPLTTNPLLVESLVEEALAALEPLALETVEVCPWQEVRPPQGGPPLRWT